MDPTTDTGRKATIAIKDTVRTYLSNFGINLDPEEIEKSIRDNPLPFAAIAAAAGFIVGGGITTRPVTEIFALFSGRVAKATAANFITGMIRRRTR
jgi:hypothetical protein